MAKYNKTTTVRVSVEKLEVLQLYAKFSGISMQDLINEAIDSEYLPRNPLEKYIVEGLMANGNLSESIKRAFNTIFGNSNSLDPNIISRTLELLAWLELDNRTILTNQKEMHHMHEQIVYLLDLVKTLSDEVLSKKRKLPFIVIDDGYITLLKDMELGTSGNAVERDNINAMPYIHNMINFIKYLWDSGLSSTTFSQNNRVFRLLIDIVNISNWRFDESVKFDLLKILNNK